jgi:hypothetical protein
MREAFFEQSEIERQTKNQMLNTLCFDNQISFLPHLALPCLALPCSAQFMNKRILKIH